MSSSIEEILKKKSMDVSSSTTIKSDILATYNIENSKLIKSNDENVEENAVVYVERLLKNWDSSIENNDKMNNPEDYSLSVNKYWETYQKFRTNFDAAFAFVVGNILNRCREKFFNDQEKGFKKYLESQISFSVRLAYDFMAISKELAVFKDKKLTMEKLRALLTVAKSGVDINQLYSKVEDLEIKDILSLKTSPKSTSPNVAFSLGQISSSVLALEKKVHDFFIAQSRESLTEHQLIIISSAQEKLASILSMIDNNISNTQK